MTEMFCSFEKSSSRENPVLPIEKFPSRVTTPYYSIFAPLSVKWSLTGGKNKNFGTFSAKSGYGAYNRWSLTRGSIYSDLTGKRLVF